MSLAKSWYLEKQIDGIWHLDRQDWIPVDLPFDLVFFSDREEAVEGLSSELNRAIAKVANSGFPENASAEVRKHCERFCVALAEELAMMPQFGHLLLSEIIELPWASIIGASAAKQQAMEDWLNHLHGFGDLTRYRVIFMLWR